MAEPPASRRIDVRGVAPHPDGARLAFRVTGPRGAPALLLLQGQANHQGWWNRLRSDFDDRCLTVTFDYRGTGLTNVDGVRRDRAWTTTSFAEDAVAVLSALGLVRADVYGTSMGGRVAQELAINHSSFVRRLVLACTSPGGPHAVERSPDVRRELAASDPDKRIGVLTRHFYTDEWAREQGARLPRDLFGDPGISAADARRHLQVSDGHDAYDRLGCITAPTMVLHGEDDLMTPQTNAWLIAEHIHAASLITVPHGRHGFFDEMRVEVAATVRQFLHVAA